MSNEVIKVTAGEMVLPKPTHEGSALVVRKMPAIIQQLPSEINRAAWAAAVVGEVNKVNDCSPQSIATAVYNLAFLGLFPGSALGHAYFVPFKGQATLIPGYKGFIDLAYGTGFLKDIHCDVIVRGEQFDHWIDETGPRLKHVPQFDREPTKQNVTGAYCIYHTTTGGNGITVVPVGQILKIAKFGNGGRQTPWDTNFAAMAMKTAARRASKEWKLTGRLGRAVELDELAERDEPQGIPVELTIDDEPTPATAYKLPVD